MSLALGPQHHAMLLAMQQQQQQQGAEYDPAALARLQLFGGAGFPAEVRVRHSCVQMSSSSVLLWRSCIACLLCRRLFGL
jgi:hypothetical protein